MNAIGYCRVSTQKQADRGLSLAAQEEAISAYCKLYDLELAQVVTDRGLSAAKLSTRPAALQMVSDVRAGKYQAVVVYKLDRLFRSMLDALVVLQDFSKLGVQFHSVQEKWDTSTPHGAFAMHVMLAFAEMERKQAGERTRSIMRSQKVSTSTENPAYALRTEKGLQLAGSAPYGYMWEPGEKGERPLVPHPEEQRLLRRVHELHQVGLTVRNIAWTLGQEGFKNRAGSLNWDFRRVARLVNSNLVEDSP